MCKTYGPILPSLTLMFAIKKHFQLIPVYTNVFEIRSRLVIYQRFLQFYTFSVFKLGLSNNTAVLFGICCEVIVGFLQCEFSPYFFEHMRYLNISQLTAYVYFKSAAISILLKILMKILMKRAGDCISTSF